MVKLCSRIVMAAHRRPRGPHDISRCRAKRGGHPEEILKRYLTATQNQKFDDATSWFSKAMKTDRKSGQVKSKEVWSKESQYIFSFSKRRSSISRSQRGRSKRTRRWCRIAQLAGQFLNQLGVEEYELYTLVKEDGGWKVDSQQEVIEPPRSPSGFRRKTSDARKPLIFLTLKTRLCYGSRASK